MEVSRPYINLGPNLLNFSNFSKQTVSNNFLCTIALLLVLAGFLVHQIIDGKRELFHSSLFSANNLMYSHTAVFDLP